MATNTPHSMATEHLPMFVTGPGETDVFFIVVVVIVILVAMLFGALYFTLHALPEKMAHRVNSSQVLLISVMSLVALFTHNNYFFIGALLLAAVRFPDWTNSLSSIAKSLEEQMNIAKPLEEQTNIEKPLEEQTNIEKPLEEQTNIAKSLEEQTNRET